MASSAQQQAFVSQYGPYATQAGNRLGVSPNVVLSQWAFESNWGTSNASITKGNLGGINVPGSTTGTNYQSYNSPQAYTDSYVSTIQHNFPGAMNTGSDTNAFNNGLKNGRNGMQYYTGDQTAYGNGLASGASTIGNIDPSLASNSSNGGQGQGGMLASNASVDGGSTYYDPQTGTYTNGLSPYQNVDGTTSNPSITSSNTGALSGGYVSQDGSYVPPQAIPGVTPSSTANPVVASTSTGGTAGAVAGQPGVLLDQPFQFGLTTGLASAVNSWITGAETAVGNWMTKMLGDVFGSAVNYIARGALIILGLILLVIALWRLLDPSGEKTKQIMASGAEAAAI